MDKGRSQRWQVSLPTEVQVSLSRLLLLPFPVYWRASLPLLRALSSPLLAPLPLAIPNPEWV